MAEQSIVGCGKGGGDRGDGNTVRNGNVQGLRDEGGHKEGRGQMTTADDSVASGSEVSGMCSSRILRQPFLSLRLSHCHDMRQQWQQSTISHERGG